MSLIGIPIKLLHEAEGHTVTIELKTGEIYRGKLIEAEDSGRHTVASALPPPSRRPHVTHQKIAARGEGIWAKLKRLLGGG